MPTYSEKFLSEKLPIIGAIKDVVPVWKLMVRHPRLFFTEIATLPVISIKNAIVFCLSTATVITAALVSSYGILQWVLSYIYSDSSLAKIDVTTWFIVEIISFGAILVLDVLSAIFTYLSAICALRVPSFRKLLISALYMVTFLNTVNFFLALIGIAVLIATATVRQPGLRIGEITVPFGEPIIETGVAFAIWAVIAGFWSNFVSPTMGIVAYVYVTGITARRVLIGSVVLVMASYIVLLSIGYGIYRIAR